MAGSGALLRQCPLLLPQNRERSVYEGFVTAQPDISKTVLAQFNLNHTEVTRTTYMHGIKPDSDRDFHVRILLPSDFQLKNARIQCSWRLKKILHGYHQIVKQRLQHCSDLVSFMVELKTILEAALKNAQELHAPPPPEYYSYLVRDIETLGWNNVFEREYFHQFPVNSKPILDLVLKYTGQLSRVVYVDTGLNTIRLKGEDTCGRQHLITLKLNAKYPAEPPDCFVDFPVEFAISWIPQVCGNVVLKKKDRKIQADKDKRITDILNKFQL